ncbi:MAG: hypothetical protein KBF31_05515, partial [Chitinophagales bacterium]|nr:hypothetical protein [Chitinophagales bacterium]
CKRHWKQSFLPNKPNLLVAPNGFGKSSCSIGFDSLIRAKIELDTKNYHQNNDAYRPILSIQNNIAQLNLNPYFYSKRRKLKVDEVRFVVWEYFFWHQISCVLCSTNKK